MRPFFTKLVAALTLGSALAVSVPAEARPDWRGDRGGWDRGHRGDGRWDRGWRGDRGWDRGWRGDRWGGGWDRGYRYDRGPRGYYAPRYYGYGYGPPRYRYYRDRDNGALAALAGIAIGAAIVAGQ
jgi:hypothetical protein